MTSTKATEYTRQASRLGASPHLGDRKLTPESASAVESVPRSELLDALHKFVRMPA